MNFNSLSSNERLAAYGAVAAIVGTLLTVFGGGFGAGGLWLTLLLGIGMLAIVFMPQLSPQTALPGSKGSLMLVVGGIAALGAVLGLLALLSVIGFLGSLLANALIYVLGLLLGIAGGLLMGWAGWQEFQAEGGSFQLGTGGSGTAAGSTAATAPRNDTPRNDPPYTETAREDTPGTAGTSTAWTDTTASGHTAGDPSDARTDDPERPSNR